jgi:hypothetical protein
VIAWTTNNGNIPSAWAPAPGQPDSSSATTNIPISEISRWRHFLAVPISLEGEAWSELPVGAFVLASSALESSSTLNTQSATVEARIDDWLPRVAPFLDPRADLGGRSLLRKILG